MKKIFDLSRIPTPVILLGLLILSFGLLIPSLGFYWDDWPVILLSRINDSSAFWEFYRYDRPFSAWTYILTTPLLGSKPFNWHIFTLLLRWATTAGLWWSLSLLWPKYKRQVAEIALLFAVYPLFNQQSIAVAYSQHWTCYALYFLSIGTMIQSIKRPQYYLPLTGISLLTAILHLATMEYFIGLELLRPIFLWVILDEGQTHSRQRFSKTLLRWSPYLVVIIGTIAWRLFFLQFPGDDPNRPALLLGILGEPVGNLLRLIQITVQDIIHMLVAVWYDTLQPQQLVMNDLFTLLSWVLGIIAAVLCAAYLIKLKTGRDHQKELTKHDWMLQALVLSLAAIFFGTLPIWITDRQVISGLYASRFALAATFGTSILWVVFIEWLTPRRSVQVVLLASMIGLATGTHLRTANEFRWIWVNQTRFYWQLAWRAPQLLPNTVLLSDGEKFKYVGDYATSAAITVAYPPASTPGMLSYWLEDLQGPFSRFQTEWSNGFQLERGLRTMNFTGYTNHAIVIDYTPEAGRCLWVLSAQDRDNPEISALTEAALPLSDLSIISGQNSGGYPPANIFGEEPEHTWCYYYQQAELARHLGDWSRLGQLAQDVERLNYEPNNYQEWLPFIEGYAHRGEWQKAKNLTLRVSNKNDRYNTRLLNLWEMIADSTPLSPERQIVLEDIKNILSSGG